MKRRRLLPFFRALPVLLGLAVPLAAQTAAEDYYRRGLEREQSGDLAGAMTDFNQAIAVDPEYADALTNRGALRRARGDLRGALADCDKALAANLNHLKALNNRGNARRAQGDFDGALADFDRAISLKPDYANALVNRGSIKAARGDFTGAIADYDKDLQLNPADGAALIGRGTAKNAAGNFAGAVADYTAAIELAKGETAYAWLFRHLTLRRLQRDDLRPDLFQAMAGWKDGWIKTIGRYVTGDLPEADFLTAAGSGRSRASRGRQCEAFHFVGMGHLLHNERAEARLFLEKCVATNEPTYAEFTLAGAELAGRRKIRRISEWRAYYS